MTKIKKLMKSIFGVYMVHIMKECFYRFFKQSFNESQLQFEEKSLKLYSEFINENDIVFDVGANFGNRVKTFLKLKAKVIAIEPQKACCKYIQKRYGKDIIMINKAVGDMKGKKNMFISSVSAVSSLSEDWIHSVEKGRYKKMNWDKCEIVEQITLDEIIDKYGNPVFIKIDVEGYELKVLNGLNRKVKVISFEYTIPEQTDKAIKCIARIKEINNSIECNYSKGESMKFELDNWISDEEMVNLIKGRNFSSDVGDIYVRKI